MERTERSGVVRSGVERRCGGAGAGAKGVDECSSGTRASASGAVADKALAVPDDYERPARHPPQHQGL